MQIPACPICDSTMRHAFAAKILHRHEVDYFRCAACGFLRTQEPFWLEEAYRDAIVDSDTGLVARNIGIACKLAVLLSRRFDPAGRYLDMAGGYGMLTRLMRDLGFDYRWNDKYCDNVLARGFEGGREDAPFTALTAFEVLEHVHDPVSFVRDTMRDFSSRTLIFSTELYEGEAAPSQDWWYYAFSGGQHISFYQRDTLVKLGARLGLHFYSLHGMHILTDRVIDMGPIMRVAMGRLAPLAAYAVRRKLGSRTMADHQLIVRASGGR